MVYSLRFGVRVTVRVRQSMAIYIWRWCTNLVLASLSTFKSHMSNGHALLICVDLSFEMQQLLTCSGKWLSFTGVVSAWVIEPCCPAHSL